MPKTFQSQPGKTETKIPEDIVAKFPANIQEELKRTNIKVTASASMATYSGPWPPAPILAEYEDRFPGWGTRMLELTEKQVAHRQRLEAIQVERAEGRLDRGQALGFAVAILSLIAAVGILVFAPGWPSAFASLGIALVGVGGPAVARILAAKFRWPGATVRTNSQD